MSQNIDYKDDNLELNYDSYNENIFLGKTSFGFAQFDVDEVTIFLNSLYQNFYKKSGQEINYIFFNANNVNPCALNNHDITNNNTDDILCFKSLNNDLRYDEIWYYDIWNGIDLRYYYEEDKLKYDFILHPNSNPNDIQIKINGAMNVIVNDDNLSMLLSDGSIIQDSNLYSFYKDKMTDQIQIKYKLLSNNIIGYNIEQYDTTKSIIIDPIIDHSLFISGSNNDEIVDVCVNDEGNILIVGVTNSNDIPKADLISSYNGKNDIFFIELDPTCSYIKHSTYIGGSGNDRPNSLLLTSSGQIYISGTTDSFDFPIIGDSFDTEINSTEGFLIQLDQNNLNILFSSFVGGDGDEEISDMIMKDESELLIAGTTTSDELPYYSIYGDMVSNGGQDTFILSIKIANNKYNGGLCIGGSSDEYVGSLEIINGYIFFAGSTRSNDFQTSPDSYDNGLNGLSDGFVCYVYDDLSNIYLGTLIGGDGNDCISEITRSIDGNLLIAGTTNSLIFPTTENSIRNEPNGPDQDIFISELKFDLSEIITSTLFGGSGKDNIEKLVIDEGGNPILVGTTDSPLLDGFNQSSNGGTDIFLAILSPDLSYVKTGTIVGGSQDDFVSSSYHFKECQYFIFGNTYSSNMIEPEKVFSANEYNFPLGYLLQMFTDDPPQYIDYPSDVDLNHGDVFLFDVNATDSMDENEITFKVNSIPKTDIEIDPHSGELFLKGSVIWFERPPFILNVTISVSDRRWTVNHSFNIRIILKDLPITFLDSPENGLKVACNGETILSWHCSDIEGDKEENIRYNLYFSQDLTQVTKRDEDSLIAKELYNTSYQISELESGAIYYWSAVPIVFGVEGEVNGIYKSIIVNSLPYFVGKKYFDVTTGKKISIPVKTIDNDTEDSSNYYFYLLDSPVGMKIVNETGIIIWTPNNDQSLLHKVHIRVTDGYDLVDNYVYINVNKESSKSSNSPFIIIISLLPVLIILFTVTYFFLKNRIFMKRKGNELVIGPVEKEKPRTVGCDVSVTSNEAYSRISNEQRKNTYEELYGERKPEN